MSTFRVTEVNPTPNEWQSANGAMLTYYLKGSLDGGAEEQVQINTTKAKPKVPFVGELIESMVSKDHPQYGKTLKRVQAAPQAPAPTASPLPYAQEHRPEAKREWVPSPATEVPYLSLKAAVEFASAKVDKKMDISGADVVKMARVFQEYLEGHNLPAEQSNTEEPPLFPEEEIPEDLFPEDN